MKNPGAALAAFPLLQDMADKERRALAAHVIDRSYPDGESVFRTGDEAQELLFLIDGRLRLEFEGSEIGFVDAGEVVGAASLVTIGLRECDATADGPTRALALDRESYVRLRVDDPKLALGLQEAILASLAGIVRASLRNP